MDDEVQGWLNKQNHPTHESTQLTPYENLWNVTVAFAPEFQEVSSGNKDQVLRNLSMGAFVPIRSEISLTYVGPERTRATVAFEFRVQGQLHHFQQRVGGTYYYPTYNGWEARDSGKPPHTIAAHVTLEQELPYPLYSRSFVEGDPLQPQNVSRYTPVSSSRVKMVDLNADSLGGICIKDCVVGAFAIQAIS